MVITLNKRVVIDGKKIPLETVIAVTRGELNVEISSNSSFIKRMELSQKKLYRAMENNVPVYGVTTGYGKSCGKRMAMEVAEKNGQNLIKFHGCGTGNPIGIEETRAAMFCRIISLANGNSGVSIQLLEQLAAFLNRGITPVVPCEGSVGASGDLTPMSYISACLAGDRKVHYQGKIISAREALSLEKLEPYHFKAKEPLAMMNGTTVMSGIAACVLFKAHHLLSAAIWASALSVHALKGKTDHFHPFIAESKPFPGQKFVSNSLCELLYSSKSSFIFESDNLDALQDPYSIRCTPQILGVLYDALEWISNWVEIEINSTNDNPLIDRESGQILMGGNFYGGHIAFSMDSLKSALASVADMCDRQILLLVDPCHNRGLPADLVYVEEPENLYNHGFKAMSITSSALTAEALKATMPAASFSRSTESHNQDKVSMGTIAARDSNRIIELAARVVAIHLSSSVQACEIRGNFDKRPKLVELIKVIRSIIEPTRYDRPMDSDIENLAEIIKDGSLFNYVNKN